MTYPTALTRNFTWQEAEVTQHRGIDNTIPEALHYNIVVTANRMEAVRSELNKKERVSVIINSWYRCPKLNAAVGSKSSSFHPYGTAVDFIAPKFGTPRDIVAFLMQYPEEFQYDQLIWERSWVHIGWDPSGKYRSQVLTLNIDGSYSQGLA